MNLLARLGTTEWARGFRSVRCGNIACGRWVTSRQLEVRRVGVAMEDSWYCSYRCFRPAAQSHFAKLLHVASSYRSKPKRSSLGLALVRHEQITDAQYKTATKIAQTSGEDLGDIVVRHGWLTERQVTDIRATQWNCPVFPCSTDMPCKDIGFPSLLTQRYAMVPLHHTGDALFVGFVYEVDYAVLYAIESIVGCPTRPCMVTAGDFKLMASQMNTIRPSQEWSEQDIGSCEELTDALCEQGISCNAEHVAIVRCGDTIWCRLKAGGRSFDLLFRRKDSMRSATISA